MNMAKSWITHLIIEGIERGLVPDWLSRSLVRRMCGARLRETDRHNQQSPGDGVKDFADQMRQGPIAPVPEKANAQHYELPTDFFELMLGPRLKYSCCYFPAANTSLEEAEVESLRLTCERAEITDGMNVLELGCGWGSLTLWMLGQFPNTRVTAVSNSAVQRQHIMDCAEKSGVANRLNVITADINDFIADQQFDRVVSCEMFEHMRNYELLLQRIASWLTAEGKLFIHIFCHHKFAYEFQTQGATNWMGRYFFTGGIMPSFDLLKQFDEDFQVAQSWSWDGTHYQRTCNAWLKLMDNRKDQVLDVLEQNYGVADAKRWFYRWRLFLIASAELFGFQKGQQWMVGHFLLEHQDPGKASRRGGTLSSSSSSTSPAEYALVSQTKMAEKIQ